MALYITILILSVVTTCLMTWILVSNYYRKKEHNADKLQIAFSKIAQEAIKNQQEQLLIQNSSVLQNRIDLFKAQEIEPINNLLTQFKASIDNYQKNHEKESLEIKNAISTAEKYAKALTTNQNSKGEFGEEWLENVLNFAGLKENIHYKKQFVSGDSKPDFIIFMPENRHLIIDSKVILKNYIDFCNEENNETSKKAFISDLNECVNNLGKKNYEDIELTNQPGFILMYIPIESCVNMIYANSDFKKIIENANAKNIIITGTSSLLVTLRLVNNLWNAKTRNDNIENIIDVGEKLYNKIAKHAQNLINIQQVIDKAHDIIHNEIKDFKTDKGSIFKEAQNLREFGIEAKSRKSGRKITENAIPEEFLTEISL